jgi:hypothetical protein
MSEHTCHATGCRRVVPPKMFMCRPHWHLLTPAHRRAIWATYRPGQEVTKDPSPAYLEAARAAIRYLEELGNTRPQPDADVTRWLDVADMLNGEGRHAGHQQKQVGRCVYCSCGLRVQGKLPVRKNGGGLW